MRSYFKNIILLLVIFFSTDVFADIVNLNMVPLKARVGFEKEWTESMPEDDLNWFHIAPSEERSLKITDIFKDEIPKRKRFSPKKYKPEHFTFVTKFNLSEDILNSGKFIGLYLSSIGENWEIFLNGEKIKSEVFLSQDGYIEVARKKNSVSVELPSRLLKTENVLAFHIIGEPGNEEAGFYRSHPYKIDYFSEIYYPLEDIIALFLISIYIFIGIYHINLFLNYSKAVYNLYYGFFSLSVFAYMFARTDAIYRIIDNSNWITTLEFCSLYMIFPFFGFFAENILFGKGSKFTKIYISFFSVAAAITIFSSIPMKIDILRIWQITSIIPLFYYLVLDIGFAFVNDLKNTNKDNLSDNSLSVFIKTVRLTVSGNLLFSAAIMSFCVIFDIIISLFLRYPFYSSKYGFAFFIVSITFILTNRFINSQKKIETLNSDLNSHIEELNIANRDILVSQQRYEHLVEESNDIIFSLSEDLEIRSINNAVEKHLKYDKAKLYGQNFTDIIFKNSEQDMMTINLVYEQLDEAISGGKPVSFKTIFRSNFNNEPVEMRVYLMYICEDDKRELIGRASPIIEDSLLKYLSSEVQEYEISNYLLLAEDISYRLTRNITKFFPPSDVNILRIAVREIVFNAIEHGNLNISYDEKSESMMNGNYVEFVAKRQCDPEYSSKKVNIFYELCPDHVKYIVRDQGSGFDYNKFLNDDNFEANEEFLTHGRGITMTKNIFDEIFYNDIGNEVTLIKKFENKI